MSREELLSYKKKKGLDLGQLEKDYLLELTLLLLSRETGNELIFKGGTCLYKFHGLNRFSEDLDFSAMGKLDTENLFHRLLHGLLDFGVRANLKTVREPYDTVLATLRMEGPLFNGNSMTLATVRIDINKKSKVLFPPISPTFYSSYREITPFQVLCMDPVEIVAEKIRAIVQRDKARDVYDLWFLLQKGIQLDLKLIQKKMEYYGTSFAKSVFISRLEHKRPDWENDLKRLVFGPLPDFGKVRGDIEKAIGT